MMDPEKKPLVERLSELLRMPQRWMIMDEEGNYHELKSGVKGTTVMGSSKKELYNLWFGKEEINEVQMILLDEVNTAMMQFIWDNFDEEVREENRKILKPLLEKYRLDDIDAGN